MSQYTFSTGHTVTITPISPWVIAQVRNSVPMPEAPRQTVETPEGPQEVANTSHPDYLQQLVERQEAVNRRMVQLTLELGVTLDPEAIAKPCADFRATMEKLGVTLPPEAEDDAFLYLYAICIGSQRDMDNLYRAVQGMSVVTEEAVAAATGTF